MPGWVARASARRRGSHASICWPVTVEMRAGMPDPIVGPAVGAIEPTTSISSRCVTATVSFVAVVALAVESRAWAETAVGRASASNRKADARERARIIGDLDGSNEPELARD